MPATWSMDHLLLDDIIELFVFLIRQFCRDDVINLFWPNLFFEPYECVRMRKSALLLFNGGHETLQFTKDLAMTDKPD